MLPSPIDESDWTAIVASDVVPTFKGVVDIFTPGTPGTYDPATDTYTGGTPDTMYVTGAVARGKWVRWVREAATPLEWAAFRPARVQIPLTAYSGVIPKGGVIRFTNGGDDASLTDIAFTVLLSVNGTDSAVRTIECVSTGTNIPVVLP